MPRRSVHLLLALPVAAALAVTGCAPPPTEDPAGAEPIGEPAPWDEREAEAAVTALPAGFLADFDDCQQLLTYYQANALELVGPYGLGPWGRGGAEAGAGDDAADGDAQAGASDAGGQDHSSTNVQEQGVDEADLVKTDGEIIVTTMGGRVRVVDVDTEQVVATIQLPGRAEEVHASELLLHESTLVVLAEEWGHAQPVDGRHMAFPASRTVVTTVDLSDPAQPRVVGSVRIEGSYRSARMVDDAVRMVMVTEPPGVEQTRPRSGRFSAEEEAEQTNRDLIRATTIDDWVPHRQEIDAQGRVVSTEPLLACDEIARPRDPAGLSTMSVLTFDLGTANPAPTSGTGLVAGGSTVYASTDRLIVATSGWDMWMWAGGADSWPGPEPRNRTDLHAFDISDPASTSYTGSGSVEGRLLSQWALDEQDGVIRVATTTDPPGASQSSQSSLVVLREDGDRLVQAGRVDGLGVTEHIRAVRYLSAELAAVVTFRQTDPLYLIDTSDPSAPVVAGELKIPGYSAYLHPVAEGWLLGVGQDADPETGETKGLQVSLFDIRNLSAPRQEQVLTYPDTWTSVEHDHRAFLHWPATGQVVLPAHKWDEEGEGDGTEAFGGVVTLHVGVGVLSKGERVATTAPGQDWGEPPLRSMVIGEDLWTLDWQGLSRFDLGTLEGGWVVDLP